MLKKIFLVWLSSSMILSGMVSVSIFLPNEAKASTFNDLADKPVMGWSSWSSIRKHPTEENIKAAADIMAAKFKMHGYQYVNLDDYYQLNWTTTVDKYGRWAVDPKKFPHGMKALGDYIHSKGLKFGLYVTPGIPKGAVDQNTPIEGTSYHAKDIVDLSKGQKVNFNFKNMYAIDFSKPGAQEYIDSWAKLFASYGVDYLKIDGVRTEDIQDIEAWAKALKKTGRPIHVELSNNLNINSIAKWQELSNGWRTDHDVESYGKPTTTDWEHVSRRFTHAAKWHPHAGPGGWNDFDSLNVANGKKDGLTNEEKRSYVSLWAIAASHFMIGSDLTKLDNYGFSLLTNDEIIGANQSGVAGKPLYSQTDMQVFYQKLPDGSFNIGLFNIGSTAKKVKVKWADLGIQEPAFVHDMWSHQDLGHFEAGFTARLTKHASMMIHIFPASLLTVSPKSGATEVNPSHVSLYWGAENTAESYHVQLAKDQKFTDIVLDQTVSATSIIVKNLEQDTQYYWKVSAISEKTEKQLGVYCFNTQMTTVPMSSDWVTAKRKNDDTVTLTWNPSFGAKSYTVYRMRVNSFGVSSGFEQIATNISHPTYVDSAPLENGAHYVYSITSKNAIGESEKSIQANVDKTTTQPFMYMVLGFLSIVIFVMIFNSARNRFKTA